MCHSRLLSCKAWNGTEDPVLQLIHLHPATQVQWRVDTMQTRRRT